MIELTVRDFGQELELTAEAFIIQRNPFPTYRLIWTRIVGKREITDDVPYPA